MEKNSIIKEIAKREGKRLERPEGSKGVAERAAAAAATSHATAVTASAARMQAATASTANLGAASTNLRFQLFDVVQQLSAGQNPLMILNQQGFQIAQVFTQGGSALAIFKGALSGIFRILAPFLGVLGPVAIAVGVLALAWRHYSGELKEAEERSEKAAEAAKKAQEAHEKWTAETSRLDDETAVINGTMTESEQKIRDRTVAIHEAASAERELLVVKLKELMVDERTLGITSKRQAEIIQTKGLIAALDESIQRRKDEADLLITFEEETRKANKAAQEAEERARKFAAAVKAARDAIASLVQTQQAAQQTRFVMGAGAGMEAGSSKDLAIDMAQLEVGLRNQVQAAEKARDQALDAAAKVGGTLGVSMADEARAMAERYTVEK